ncbi:MAG: hypothetical protein JO345_03990 [Streptosporangiaceae bacterium]|nr:hypothetical protein [Streptosporangiaceae bacterium]
MIKKTRAAAITALGMAVAVAASACAGGGNSGNGSSSSGQVTLSFWTNATPGPGLTYFQNAVKTYHTLHPNVTIKISMLPALLFLAVFQRRIVGGLTGALKG